MRTALTLTALLSVTPAFTEEVCFTGTANASLTGWEAHTGQHPFLKFQMSRDKGTIPAILLSNDKGELTLVVQEDNGLACFLAIGSGLSPATASDIFPGVVDQ